MRKADWMASAADAGEGPREGALLLGRVYKDSKLLVRQSTQFRNYLQLLFAAA